MSSLLAISVGLIVLETAHLFSPIVLAWSTRGFREHMLSRSERFLLIPGVALAAALASPLWVVSAVYFWWNIYHFGMQHFGVLSLWRGKQGALVMIACLLLTGAGMNLPLLYHAQWLYITCFVAFSVNHWVTDIALSSYVSRHWAIFACAVLLLGTLGFVWLVPNDHGYAKRAIPLVVQARMGLGFVHFLYSRWVWKFSDPQVRATIGNHLFRGAHRVPG